ncbi:MAG TPA: TonB-dependent receptor [Novosphingobium sp.]|nr:TonB-dependent receptor [Novosphingobium sp.]
MLNRLFKNTLKSSTILCVSAFAATIATDVSIAHAANAPADAPAAADTAAMPGEIMVTARRKSENILTTPIAISALTGDDLKDRGVVSLQDMAAYVPGLNMQHMATSGGRADRSFQQVVLRGIAPSTSTAQTTSIFIDGVPVASGVGVQNVTDPERVEVIKGPQSAYFGRQTFAGAINIITKVPTDHLTGSIQASVGSRNNHEITASLAGPIFGDVLGFRVTGQEWQKGGSYQNAGIPGQTLGDQRTRTGSLSLVFKPSSRLTVKAFGMYTENKDGPAATGLISLNGVPSAGIAANANCNMPSGVPGYCGTLSSRAAVVSGGNVLTTGLRNSLAASAGRWISPTDGTQGFGMVSRSYHLHVTADWKLSDAFTLSSLTGYNHGMSSELADFGNYYSATSSYPFMVEGLNHDFSQEGRLAFENGGNFHAVVGVSYLYAWSASDSGGVYETSTASTNTATFTATMAGASITKTLGFFYGLGYDITPKLSINFDGRYQIDRLEAISAPQGTNVTTSVFGIPAGFYPGGSMLLDKAFKNFLPRVIVNYKLDPHNMIYASYSQGVNPGSFNNSFLTNTSTAVLALAAARGYKVEVQPEHIINYEIGAKGRLFNNKLRYEVAAYMDYWYNQLNNSTLQFVDDSGTAQQLVALQNAGRVRLTGFEADLAYAVNSHIMLTANGAYTGSYILSQTNPALTASNGIANFRGNQNPYTSKWSGTLGASYTRPLGNDVDGFVRGDFMYKSGSYTDVANTTKTPDMTQVNLHIGAQNAHWNAEVFVTNLFNDRAYFAAGDGYTSPTFTYYSAVIAQLRDLRTFGLKVGYKF